jgi:glycerate 2-kinase
MFQNRDQLLAEALPAGLRQRRALALQLLEAGVAAVAPAHCTRRGLRDLAGRGLDLGRPVFLLAMGKAALAMAQQALELCKVESGIVHCFEQGQLGPLVLERCGHPLPVPEAAEQGQRMLAFAEMLGPDDVVICLISGGASAMLESPADGLSLLELRDTASLLLSCGASIGEVNTVRRALSRTKGGGLLAALYPAEVFNVILSDVPGEPLEVVSSGPTLPPLAGLLASDVVSRHALWDRLPAAVAAHLRSRPQDDWSEPDGLRLTTSLAADNGAAVAAVVDEASRHGLHLGRAPGFITGEASAAGAAFVRDARSNAGDGLVSGGECTVVLRGAGRGGRAQEFVLGALPELRGGLVAAMGTDGVDGSSDAAGALADAAVLSQCGGNFTAAHYLEHNDSHGFFGRTGTQLLTGLTGTNVSDIYLHLR